MRIIRASAMGLCFGVRDALQAAESVERAGDVTIYGELVHNPLVLAQLEERGFHQLAEADRHRLPSASTVLVTAHGVSNRERGRLTGLGKQLIDTTCPLVRRVHESAHQLAADGYHVLVIGRAGHVEVRGITEDLEHCDVVPTLDQVQTWPFDRLGVVCQTTTPPRHAQELVAAIRRSNPHADVRFINTVCQPTIDRQTAVEELCRRVDVLIVVGGANSNNTQQLVELARELGTAAQQVESAADLKPEWFAVCQTVGLTAGTSTLDETVDEVQRALEAMAASKPAGVPDGGRRTDIGGQNALTAQKASR